MSIVVESPAEVFAKSLLSSRSVVNLPRPGLQLWMKRCEVREVPFGHAISKQ